MSPYTSKDCHGLVNLCDDYIVRLSSNVFGVRHMSYSILSI